MTQRSRTPWWRSGVARFGDGGPAAPAWCHHTLFTLMIAVVAAWLTAVGGAGNASAQPDPAVDLTGKTQWKIQLNAPVNDDGRQLIIRWTRAPVPTSNVMVLVLRRPAQASDGNQPTLRATGYGDPGAVSLDFLLNLGTAAGTPGWTMPIADREWSVGSQHGMWTVVAKAVDDPTTDIVDKIDANTTYVYAFIHALPTPTDDKYYGFVGTSVVSWKVGGQASWFNTAKLGYLGLILLTGLGLFGFTWLAKRRTLFVRRIAGIDAIEDSIGRATEMGRPVLYVTGVDEAQDIQTIAGLLILGHVAKITAEYDTDIRVANAFPLTMVIAEEMVRQGYANAGRLDAHKPENIMFITSEQFAFAAGVNGIILRERPATNIYFGKFYGESLMLAETGFIAGAVQIAGTAELTQMPFFIAGCDYTLIGEELYATSAYLTREPDQMAQLKVGDMLKVVVALLVVLGVTFATLANNNVYPFTRFNFMETLFP